MKLPNLKKRGMDSMFPLFLNSGKYSFEIDHKLDSILSIDINPTRLIADTDESNNIFMSNNDE